jgi:hypothetical protein
LLLAARLHVRSLRAFEQVSAHPCRTSPIEGWGRSVADLTLC